MSGLTKKISWRISYIKKVKRGGFIKLLFPLLPEFVKKRFSYYWLRLIAKNSDGFIKLENDKNNVLINLGGNTKILIPKIGFNEGDFFDIISMPSSKLENFKKQMIELSLLGCDGPYEYSGVFLKTGDFVVDAGANIGLFSIEASKKVGRHGRVFSFEPIEEIRDFYLRKNISINKCDNVSIVPYALGETEKEVNFNVNLKNDFEGSSKYIHRVNERKIMVSQKTLDDLVNNGLISRVDFIKADIEGAERDLLKGAEITIKKYKPKIAIRTYHLPDDKYVLEKIIKDFVPEYNIIQTPKTLYAWI